MKIKKVDGQALWTRADAQAVIGRIAERGAAAIMALEAALKAIRELGAETGHTDVADDGVDALYELVGEAFEGRARQSHARLRPREDEGGQVPVGGPLLGEGSPHQIVRRVRGTEIFRTVGAIRFDTTSIGVRVYRIRSQTYPNVWYAVSDVMCTCADFQNHGQKCKHMWALSLFKEHVYRGGK